MERGAHLCVLRAAHTQAINYCLKLGDKIKMGANTTTHTWKIAQFKSSLFASHNIGAASAFRSELIEGYSIEFEH